MSEIITYSKVRFDPILAEPAHLLIADIAHALSLMCRANGHFSAFFSVGEHSLNCSLEAAARGYTKNVQLACLLHDASEAYLSDITRPVKVHLPNYVHMEEKLQNLLYTKFLKAPLTEEAHQQINRIDDTMLYYEFLEFTGECLFETAEPLVRSPNFSTRAFLTVEQAFLQHFERLYSEI